MGRDVKAWRDESSNGWLGHRIGELLTEIATAEMDLPHIVVCRDSSGCNMSFSGPYGTALEAIAAAEFEQRTEIEAAAGDTLTFEVAALYPALPRKWSSP